MQDAVTLLLGDCAEKLKEIPDASIDLVVTSPPYDNLRQYKGYSFEFEKIAGELCRVIKAGGVIVWVVGDATVHGSETGTSFRQSLYFKDLGLNLHDTMIWEKTGMLPTQDRYYAIFEYMFCFSKGKPKSMNFICDHKTVNGGRIQKRDKTINKGHNEKAEGYFVRKCFGRRTNIWRIHIGKNETKHPAIFPLQLAADHIQSWSNEGDTVLDPFLGSGTTGVAAVELNRKFIGIEIAPEYFEMAKQRIANATIKPLDIVEEKQNTQEYEYDSIWD